MRIRTKLLITALVPCVAIALLGAQKTIEDARDTREMTNAARVTVLSQAISDLVHEAQKERGLTAGFLGSNGTKMHDELLQQRKLTDEKLKSLRAAARSFESVDYPYLADQLADAMSRFDRLEGIRSSVTSQSIPLGSALKYYTGNHTRLLNFVSASSTVSEHAGVNTRLAAYSQFLKGKERAGIERAVLSATFANDSFAPGMHSKLIRLIAEQDAHYGEFLLLADPESLAFYENATKESAFTQTHRMRLIALDKASEGGFGIDASVWFGTMTEKINHLKAVENNLAANLITFADTERARATRALAIALLFSAGSLLATTILMFLVIRSIMSAARQFNRAAIQLEQGTDVDALSVLTRDELGYLARAMNGFFASLREANASTRELTNQIRGLSASQAMAEFQLDGTVVTANHNFCLALGYSAEEIKGQHHSLFVDSDLASSEEYQGFWSSLSGGKLQVGEYRAVRKDGSEIWLLASYNPIIDDSGKPYKIVALASDITAKKTSEIQMKQESEEARSRDQRRSDELAELVDQVGNGAHQIDSGTQKIALSTRRLSEGASTQASNLEQISASLEEVASQTNHNADHAKEAASLSADSQSAASRGAEEVRAMNAAMSEIHSSSSEIAKIINVIDEIAFQTNLLALNAAVEAARAGESGKGFAVVAEEVRNLAQRSAEAAKSTSEMIEESSRRAERGVEIAHRVDESLGEIVASTSKVSVLLSEISVASTEQAQGVGQINRGVAELDNVTQQTAANSQELASTAQEAASQVEKLRLLVERHTQ